MASIDSDSILQPVKASGFLFQSVFYYLLSLHPSIAVLYLKFFF